MATLVITRKGPPELLTTSAERIDAMGGRLLTPSRPENETAGNERH